MRLSPRNNDLTSLFKEVRVFKVGRGFGVRFITTCGWWVVVVLWKMREKGEGGGEGGGHVHAFVKTTLQRSTL